MPGERKSALELEEETQKVVSVSLSKIEVALSEWDSARDKPGDLGGQVGHLRHFHSLLSAWELDSLKGAKDEKSARVRLRRFFEICGEIEASGVV